MADGERMGRGDDEDFDLTELREPLGDSQNEKPQPQSNDLEFFDARKATFTRPIEMKEQLCEAGFYQAAEGVLQCYKCTLRINRADLDLVNYNAWELHARFNDQCQHVEKAKGQDFIHKAKAKKIDSTIAIDLDTRGNSASSMNDFMAAVNAKLKEQDRKMTELKREMHDHVRKMHKDVAEGADHTTQEFNSLHSDVSLLAKSMDSTSKEQDRKLESLHSKVDDNKREHGRQMSQIESQLSKTSDDMQDMKDNAKAMARSLDSVKESTEDANHGLAEVRDFAIHQEHRVDEIECTMGGIESAVSQLSDDVHPNHTAASRSVDQGSSEEGY